MPRFLALFGAFVLAFVLGAAQPQAQELDPENTLYMDLKDGRVVIQLRPDLAPKHVMRIKQLVREGFYDGLTFHRVIPGFMAQGGDPAGDGSGGTNVNLPAEFSDVKFDRGTVAAARLDYDINSGDSQFFIMFKRTTHSAKHLDGKYTVWGQVVQGMEFVDNLKKGSPEFDGAVRKPHDKILKMQVAADARE